MDRLSELYYEMFEKDFKDAQAFHHRAEQFQQQGQYSLVFNIGSIALERYLVALCGLYGVSPENHNYDCLMDTVEALIDFPPILNQEIRSLDLLFGICSLDEYHHELPEPSDADRVMAMCAALGKLFDAQRISDMKAELSA